MFFLPDTTLPWYSFIIDYVYSFDGTVPSDCDNKYYDFIITSLLEVNDGVTRIGRISDLCKSEFGNNEIDFTIELDSEDFYLEWDAASNEVSSICIVTLFYHFCLKAKPSLISIHAIYAKLPISLIN